METKKDKLDFAKERAYEYLKRPDNYIAAWSSFCSDLLNADLKDDTGIMAALEIGTSMLVSGAIKSNEEMRRFIDGFN